jgi:hypothetical protein
MPRGANEQLLLVSGILVGLLVLFLLVRAVSRGHNIPCVVLLEYRVSDEAEDGCYIVVAGRPEGIWAWFLSLLGLGTKIRFEVTRSAVQCEIVGANWRLIDSVPLQNVGGTRFGYSNTTFFLVLGIYLVLQGAGGSSLLS